MQMKAWPLAQPAVNERRLVGGVVVEEEVDFEVRWNRLIDGVEDLAKLHGAMATMTATDDRPRLDIQRREERRRGMANVVVGAPFHLARAHRQQRLGAIQG